MGVSEDETGERPGRRPGRVTSLLLGAAVLVAGTSAVAAVTTSRAGDPGLQDVAAAGTAAPSTTAAGDGWLSAGAPAGARTLPAEPVTAVAAAPADEAAVSGLAANGIPAVALNAYRVAAARMGTADPSCRIDWSLLAGIGRVESNHGRFGGAELTADGTSTPPIVGPALDGVGFAFVRDTDGGRWDGDTGHDRAVGPMQFIPSTWRSYAVDADGSGVADPFDIDDESLAAAHYLCVAGGDLSGDAGRRRAVLAYNHSDSYVAQVLALARSYALGIPVADLPLTGDTTSPVPAPRGDLHAPAAPGPAIGAADTTPSRPGQPTALPSGSAPAAAQQDGGAPAGGPDGGTPSSGGDGDPAPAEDPAPAPVAPQPAPPAAEQPPGGAPPPELPVPAPTTAAPVPPLPLPTLPVPSPSLPVPALPSLPVPLPGQG